MRFLGLTLVVLLVALQWPLWFGKGGWMRVRELDQQLVALAKLSLMHPGQWRPHFFTFGGTGQSISWISAVQAGRFQLNDDGSGFSI